MPVMQNDGHLLVRLKPFRWPVVWVLSRGGHAMIKCKVYTNDGRGHFFGFDEDAELTMVMSFEVEDRYGRVREHNGDKHCVACDVIFDELNRPDPTAVWSKEYKDVRRLRSLSTGDVVVVGETAWAVESVGWRILGNEEFRNAIIWDDEIGAKP